MSELTDKDKVDINRLADEAIAGVEKLERKNIIQGFIIWLLLCVIVFLVMMP